jgi:hypothetical protein
LTEITLFISLTRVVSIINEVPDIINWVDEGYSSFYNLSGCIGYSELDGKCPSDFIIFGFNVGPYIVIALNFESLSRIHDDVL